MASPTAAAAVPPSAATRQMRVVFAGLVLAMLLAALDSTIVATALPTIVGELGGLEHLSWVVTAYLLAQTIVAPLYGKLGDLYGRKGVLQAGILIFLGGSALCGLSGSMAQLILFRFVQGLGGGGLMVTTQAVVGDIVPPRERGRYQGIFGAVFGVASIAGPLLGGYFTTHLSWRWIFYVNLPLGVIAMLVLAATLPPRAERVRHSVDYGGALLLALTLGGTVVVTDLGGVVYPWSSPAMIGLLAATVLACAGFLGVERRAEEPVLPLRLFADRTFAVAAGVGLVVGFALFGSVTYLPLFLQVVKGASPTASGLQMLPLMGGMLVTSIASGQIISRTGRYKVFPVAGTAVMTVGLFLMSRLDLDTPLSWTMLVMLVLGLGLGLVMQVLVIAVQNAVAYADLGVATSGTTLFRLVGGSVGTAALGAVFAARLARELARLLPQAAAGSINVMNPHALAALPADERALFAAAFTAALGTLFRVAAGIALVGCVLAWLLPERPLRKTLAAATGEDMGSDVGQAFAMPTGTDSLTQVLRGLAALADRDVRRQHIEAIVARAGLDLSAAEAWLLLRLEDDASLDTAALARERQVAPEILETALARLQSRGFLAETAGPDGRPCRPITHAGCDAFNRLAAARRERLAEVFADWSPAQRAGVAESLQRLSRELVPEGRTPA